MNHTSSNNIQSVVFDPESASFTDLAGSSRVPGPPNYYNALERSVYLPNDGTGNVGSFSSAIGGNPFTLGNVPESNAGAFAARSDATNSHLPFGSTNVNLFPDRERADPPSPILNENSLRRAYEAHLNEFNFPGTVGTIRGGGSISTNREGTEKSFVSASIADSTDFDSVSIANDKRINTSFKDIHDSILYGDKKGLNTSINSFDAHVPNPFTSRSPFNIQIIDDYDKSIEKANHGYTSEGPPILTENVTLQVFQDWQSDLFDFVERLPNYYAGMLFHKPNFSILSPKDQRRLCNLFKMVHGYLKKAGAKNKKIRTVTANVSTYPYPDIVQWWAEVNAAFQLTTKEIDDLVEELNHIQQRPEESCMDYLLRYQSKANELQNIGRKIPDEEQGRQCLKGMHSKYRFNVLQFFAIEKIFCNIKYFRQLCHVQDEYAKDSIKITKDNELEANLATTSSYSRRNRRRGIYGPASNATDKPMDDQQYTKQNQGKRKFDYNQSSETRSDSRNRGRDNRSKERQDLYRSVSRDKNSSRADNHRDLRRSDSRERAHRQPSKEEKSHHSKSKGDDRFYTLDEMRAKDKNNNYPNTSSNFRSPFPCNPTEGMTMTYTKLANGEYTWALLPSTRRDKSDYHSPSRANADRNLNDNLEANLTFEYEKVINFGDF